MKHHSTLIYFAVAIFTAACPLRAQDSKETAKPPSADDQLKLTMPGPEHERLAGCTGTWEVAVKMGAGAGAIQYHGTANSRMIVGGRFLQIDYLAESKGGRTEGVFHVGYDPRHKHFALIAMDSFGPYFVTSQGKQDEATGKIRMLDADDDPHMKTMGYTKEFIHILDIRSPDEFAIEVWFIDTRTPARREFKYMDYSFTRKK
jgi:hypothetical protein